MSIAQSFLAEFEQELGTTRKFLERVPEGKLTWKPHEKSMSAGELALHIATAPAGVAKLASQDRAEVPNFSAGRHQPRSVKEVLDALDESARAVRDFLSSRDDANMPATRAGRDSAILFALPLSTAT